MGSYVGRKASRWEKGGLAYRRIGSQLGTYCSLRHLGVCVCAGASFSYLTFLSVHGSSYLPLSHSHQAQLSSRFFFGAVPLHHLLLLHYPHSFASPTTPKSQSQTLLSRASVQPPSLASLGHGYGREHKREQADAGTCMGGGHKCPPLPRYRSSACISLILCPVVF